jgi:hypothetical protein
MNEDRLDDLLREAAREYNDPPAVPAEEMWARIEASRKSRRRPLQRLRAVPPRVWWPAAAAAVLAIGIGIGRISDPGPDPIHTAAVESTSPAGPVASGPAAPDAVSSPDAAAPQGAPGLYAFAAARYFDRTEAMLTAFQRNGHDDDSFRELSGWARDLLVETRLFLGSPAAEDPVLQMLFVDLEVVLAEIVQMSAHRQDEERPWVEAALDEKSILLRLQTNKPAVANPSRG